MKKDMAVTQSDEAFEKELQKVMDEEPGKKPKKRKRRWSLKKKLLVGGIGLAGLVWIISSAFGGTAETAPMVDTAPLSKGSIAQTLTLNGPVSGTDSVDVVSNLHVEVVDIAVKEGDRVTKDQVLATLDSSILEREITAARTAYELAVATREESRRAKQLSYEKAVQDFQVAQRTYERTKVLYDSGDIAKQEFEAKQDSLTDAKRQLESFDVKNGQVQEDPSAALQVQNAQLALENKQRDLDNTQVKSPIDGTVVRVNSKVGRFADKTEDEKPMFIIENLDELEMEISVSEYSIGKVALGQSVTISADILDGSTVNGEVVAISPTGEAKGDGTSERVIPITIKIKDDNTKLIAGITAKATILLAEASDTYIVQIASLIQQEDGTLSIAVEEQGTIRMIGVETGVESDFQVEIKAREGFELTDGMNVVLNPMPGLTDGMAVTTAASMASAAAGGTDPAAEESGEETTAAPAAN